MAKKMITKKCGNCAGYTGKRKNDKWGRGLCETTDTMPKPDDKPCKKWKGKKYQRVKTKIEIEE